MPLPNSIGAVSARTWTVRPLRVGSRRLPTLLATAVFLVALGALALGAGKHPAAPDRPSGAQAIRTALHDREIRRYLDRSGFTRTRTIPLDRELMRVSFFNGQRIVLEAAVGARGRVPHTLEYPPGYVRAGSPTIQTPIALLLFSAIFAIAVAWLPVRRIRNLDVLALLSFAIPIVLLNERLFELSVYASYPPLLYLCLRCLKVAFAGRAAVRDGAATPLYAALTSRWSAVRSRRMLWIGTLAAALVLAIVSTAGGSAGDVGFASIAGATRLLDGGLPYGHLPGELVHGDTYPLLAYALYIPAAVFAPVHNAFDNLDGALVIAVVASLATAVAVYLASARAVGNSRTIAIQHSLAWLTFPPVLVAASSGSNDLVAAALVAVAFALAGYAGRSTAALAVAGWVKLIPLFLVPIAAARFRSGRLISAIGALTAVTAAVGGWILLVGGVHGIEEMFRAISFQSERGSLLSIWTAIGAKPLQIAVEAAVFALVAFAAARVWQERELATDVRRLAALSAAVMIAFQLSANYWTYAYLPWVLPCVLLALFPAPAESPALER